MDVNMDGVVDKTEFATAGGSTQEFDRCYLYCCCHSAAFAVACLLPTQVAALY